MADSSGYKGAGKKITLLVTAWEGVTARPHQFGGTEYRFGNREIGHIHGDRMVDIPFPTSIRRKVVSTGQAEPHHLLPNSGWISFYIHQEADISRAVDLLRRSFQLAKQQKRKRQSQT